MDTILNAGEGIAEGRRIWAERNPMGRMGTPDELTGAVVLLSSNAGSYITGNLGRVLNFCIADCLLGMDAIIDGGQTLF